MKQPFNGTESFPLRITESMSQRLAYEAVSVPGSTVSSVVQMYLLSFIKKHNHTLQKDQYVESQSKTVATSFWLTKTSIQQLQKIAQENGLSASETMRKIILMNLP